MVQDGDLLILIAVNTHSIGIMTRASDILRIAYVRRG